MGMIDDLCDDIHDQLRAAAALLEGRQGTLAQLKDQRLNGPRAELADFESLWSQVRSDPSALEHVGRRLSDLEQAAPTYLAQARNLAQIHDELLEEAATIARLQADAGRHRSNIAVDGGEVELSTELAALISLERDEVLATEDLSSLRAQLAGVEEDLEAQYLALTGEV